MDVSAALSADHKFLTVAVVNPTESAQKMDLQISGVKLGGESRMWQMTGASPDAADVVGKATEVGTVETSLPSVPTTVTVAPISVSIYQFPVQ